MCIFSLPRSRHVAAPLLLLQCSCIPYVKGRVVAPDTVWYGNLKSTAYDEKGAVSTKHSGDILTGSTEKGDIEDLERIYVDLENTADNVDCLAFEGNGARADRRH